MEKTVKILREMLTSALRTLVKNPVKESFYGKRKKNKGNANECP